MRDRHLLYAAGAVRAIGVGVLGPLLGVHLAATGASPGMLGIVVGAGLAGAALAAALVTWRGDRWGRRCTCAVLCGLSALGAVAVLIPASSGVVLAAAFIGMLNGMGKDRGAIPVLESAMLPSTTDERGRTVVFARATALQDVGLGVGAALSGLPTLLLHAGIPEATGTAWTIAGCALLAVFAAPLYLALSPAVEVARAEKPLPLSPAGRRSIAKLSALFSLDSIGGGFLSAAGMAYIFREHFHASAAMIAALFVGARILNAASHLVAAWLATRIGLVNTMVFTHIPSSVLLLTVAFAPNFPIAAVLFLLREGLVEMDVPTRQSYVMAVVAPHERTAASGITALVRMGGWSLGAFLAAPAMAAASVTAPLIAGAGLKIVYDLALWRACKHTKPPEEARL